MSDLCRLRIGHESMSDTSDMDSGIGFACPCLQDPVNGLIFWIKNGQSNSLSVFFNLNDFSWLCTN